ncbi:MAG: EAL domain-containing response regulator [Rhodanobacter sp.]
MTIAENFKFLVVEDHPFQRTTLQRMLRAMGAQDVREAADGARALELIDGVDIVICDLNMPGMDGMEFIRHVGAAKHELSIIIMSAESGALLRSVETMTRAYGVRLLGVVEKPVTPDDLEDLIANYEKSSTSTGPVRPRRPQFGLAEIQRGIQENQFEPFFQPKVDLADGAVVGAEALARWRTAQHGIVGPSAFIPQLETHGQIDELTYIMVEKSAQACRQWRSSKHDINVSVNLSLLSLSDVSIADRITRIVSEAGLEPRHMILEITETAAMTEVASALENLTRLRMRGFGLAVDDYGTGFSSLSQISRVPYTELKIDQTFVTGCTKNPTHLAIVSSCIDLARQLGIHSVAEGVETQADWDAVDHAGCRMAQGYLIARPMAGNQFLDFLQQLGTGRS